MQVINETKGTIVAKRLRLAASPWARFWGLMGRKALPDGEALLLKPCSSIHTLFMRFPIDVVFIDPRNQVVKVVPELRPFRVAMAPGGAQAVLELEAGAAARADVAPGDRLAIVNACEERRSQA